MYCKFYTPIPLALTNCYLIGTFCIVNLLTPLGFALSSIFNRNILYCKYYWSYIFKVASWIFNRNILYCKCNYVKRLMIAPYYLIGTFCIVNRIKRDNITKGSRFNRNILYCKSFLLTGLTFWLIYLIGTFCIVNVTITKAELPEGVI